MSLCREIFPTGNRWNRALFTKQKSLKNTTKFRLPLKLSLLRGSCSKSVRTSPTFGSQCSTFHPNRFTFDGVIAERVKAVLLAHRVFPIFVFGRITNISTTRVWNRLAGVPWCWVRRGRRRRRLEWEAHRRATWRPASREPSTAENPSPYRTTYSSGAADSWDERRTEITVIITNTLSYWPNWLSAHSPLVSRK